MNAYEVLGKWGTEDGKPLPKDADKAMIKKAYRRASKKAHPDRNGGDVKAMVAVNVANDILSDPKRRERHDLGYDDATTAPPLELKARMVLAQAFTSALSSDTRVNYVAHAKAALGAIASQSHANVKDINSKISRLEKALPLVSFDKKDPEAVNVWEDQIRSLIGSLRDQREAFEMNIRGCDRARELIVAYSCSVIDRAEMFDGPFGLERIIRDM